MTGVDGSARQIRLARAHVPAAAFLHADMTGVELPAASFDGVAAFYSITHVPAAEQGPLLARIGSWLKPGGIFVGSFGAGKAHDWTGDWLGTEMFFSHNDEATSVGLVRRAGLKPLRTETVEQDNEDARFLWILARKLDHLAGRDNPGRRGTGGPPSVSPGCGPALRPAQPPTADGDRDA